MLQRLRWIALWKAISVGLSIFGMFPVLNWSILRWNAATRPASGEADLKIFFVSCNIELTLEDR